MSIADIVAGRVPKEALWFQELSPKIAFTPGMSDEVRAAIEPHLRKWGFLIPGWCRELNVTWKDDDDRGALNILVHYEYRRADMNVLANFMSITHRREQNVVHELLHIVTAPLCNTMQDFRNALKPELVPWADEMIRHSSESVTCDLQAMTMDFFSPRP